ncbi:MULTISPECIES: hypothetical protein [Convivina]|uniref:hypothetical protein n=1 Tax=Convivina TaxID=1697027 RepID=UPI00200F7CAB|nr:MULTISPECIES: hypothetical protein [Convivina]CAH1853885.1 hypothetical protein R078131_00856 [Convivina intestini]CAH1855788.1 hypothetical protein R078138_01211 [Convivina sp. LMG 32447]
MKFDTMISNPLPKSVTSTAELIQNQVDAISKIANGIKVPDFTNAISGVATVGNTAAYMVAFLLPGTRRLIIARYLPS